MWQEPTVCAPDRATMSSSVKPFGWKMSRRWSMPLSPSGRRPTCDSTESEELAASLRPNLVGTSGPPISLMATFAARAHMSATEQTAGQYLSVMSFRRPFANSGRPALAPKAPSPPSVKRSAALGQPPLRLPSEKTPASCHDRRMRIGPQLFAFTRAARSASRSARLSAPPRAWRATFLLRRPTARTAKSAAAPATTVDVERLELPAGAGAAWACACRRRVCAGAWTACCAEGTRKATDMVMG
mmetsp:Transcript_52756/g.155427  ORF Transcript_52756/g.155427 Transcript_52756/m.155427 type:complete len:243 (-) Transcript_52756:66-794(-)